MPFKDVILFLHPTFGVLGLVAAVWVLVEALNASENNQRRIYIGSCTVAVLFALTWFFAGWYYTVYYHNGDQQLIMNGPAPWAHSYFMETKEHLFFAPLILAFLLPIVARVKIWQSRPARNTVLVVTALIAFQSLAIEGAGAIINWGAKSALAHTSQNVPPHQLIR